MDADGAVSDSLQVANHFTDASAQVESIYADSKVLLASQYQSLIDEIAVFNAGGSSFSDMDALVGDFWRDDIALAAGS